jgi:hypothetical protein
MVVGQQQIGVNAGVGSNLAKNLRWIDARQYADAARSGRM